jgi:intracellular sulfur oxidation DsrE/DsrF family protein
MAIRTMRNRLTGLAIFWLLLTPGLVAAQQQIEHLLSAESAPSGVVFEILEDDEHALTWALPLVKEYASRLRSRHPEIEIAVVTHGIEQFGLLTSEQESLLFSGLHSTAEGLASAQVDVHVCGAHAGWYGKVPEDFPDYIDVADSGPALINDYRALGFEFVRLRQPEP